MINAQFLVCYDSESEVSYDAFELSLNTLMKRTLAQLEIRKTKHAVEENKEQKLAFSNQIKMYSFMIDRIDYELKLGAEEYANQKPIIDSLYD